MNRIAKLSLIVIIITLLVTSCTPSYYNTGVTNGCMGRRSGLVGYN